MNKQIEALKLALEAICGSGDFLFNWHDCEPNNEREVQAYQATLANNERAFIAIKEALAEQPAQDDPDLQDKDPELVEQQGTFKIGCVNHDCDKCKAQQQELVAVYVGETWCGSVVRLYEHLPLETPLYTSPPASKPWVGLTEEEINEVLGGDIRDEPSGELEFVRAIEAKLREKNA